MKLMTTILSVTRSFSRRTGLPFWSTSATSANLTWALSELALLAGMSCPACSSAECARAWPMPTANRQNVSSPRCANRFMSVSSSVGIAGNHPNAGKGLVIETRAKGRRTHVQVPGAVLVEGHRGFIDAIAHVKGRDLLGPGSRSTEVAHLNVLDPAALCLLLALNNAKPHGVRAAEGGRGLIEHELDFWHA